jgi:hypothetical protein
MLRWTEIMGDTAIPAQSEAALWSRIVRPERDDLPAEAAKAVLELDFDEADRARMHELVAARWRCGLSTEEGAGLRGCVEATRSRREAPRRSSAGRRKRRAEGAPR